MVKNKQGGNRSKKMARKNVRPKDFVPKMRYATDGEIYARVMR